MMTQCRYEETANQHGVSAQSNPSGGNFYRGLYNIAIKSLGAAMKKSEETVLEGVLEYGERLDGRKGYYFMDSPGNDIESVTGQVASGCNVVLFSTGNGSITNHPFVPISFHDDDDDDDDDNNNNKQTNATIPSYYNTLLITQPMIIIIIITTLFPSHT